MTHCFIQQNAFAASEEMRSTTSISDRRDLVVCPKPRRFSSVNNDANDLIRPLRCHLSNIHQPEVCDSKVGKELLDIIFAKGGADQSTSQFASSPPFFCGSPPTRAANPLAQDARFGQEKLTPLSPIPIPSGLSSSPSTSTSARKGCVRIKFGQKPAAVRIEGFDCLDRDRQNCRISAVA